MAKTVTETTQKVVDSVEKKKDNSQEYITLNFKGLTLPWAILLGVVIFTAGMGSALYFGLKARPVTPVAGTTGTPTPTEQTFAASEFPEVSIPYVKGPTKGDANAKVVILEFSDLVCPYCKKFHDEAYKSILTDYIQTGKANLLYKHYPLAFHNPAATLAAKASFCIDKDYGDEAMFKFNDLFFARSSSITQNAYELIGSISGVDSNKIKACMKTDEATKQLASDEAELTNFQADIVAKGLSQGLGTPSFIIGTVKDGVLSGRLVEGAYPIIAFKNVIEEQLKK
jgi:protein-disulfide isomerase